MAFDLLEKSQTLAARLDAELRHAHPRTVLEAAVEAFGDKVFHTEIRHSTALSEAPAARKPIASRFRKIDRKMG